MAVISNNRNNGAVGAFDTFVNSKVASSETISTARNVSPANSKSALDYMKLLNISQHQIPKFWSGIKLLDNITNYTDLLLTRTSFPRKARSDLNGPGKQITAEQLRNNSKAIGDLSNAFKVTFGAPFAYLEVVDPYGRVYRDTYGLHREDLWNGAKSTGLKYANSDAKVYMAFIKVGMVSQAASLEKMWDRIMQNGQDSNAEAGEKMKNAALLQAEEAFNKAKEALHGGLDTNSLGSAVVDNYKKTKATWENIQENKPTPAVSTFELTYFVSSSSMVDTKLDGWNGQGNNGVIIPFNNYILNALLRAFDLHYSQIIQSRKNINETAFGGVESIYGNSGVYNYIKNIFAENPYPFFKFVCTEESIVEDSISNQIGDSVIKGLIDKGSEVAKEISFIAGGGDPVTAMKTLSGIFGKTSDDQNAQGNWFRGGINSLLRGTTEVIGDVGETLVSGAKNLLGADVVDIALKGNSIIYPRIWKSTHIERTLILALRFYSPYGDFESVFKHVFVPLFTILGFSLPRQVYPSYTSFPFLINVQVPGLMQSDMAIVSTFTIQRGGRYSAWADNSIMKGVDITLNILPLKPNFGLPQEYFDAGDTVKGVSTTGNLHNYMLGKAKLANDIYGNQEVKGDKTFSNELLTTMGSFTISNQNINEDLSNALTTNLKSQELNRQYQERQKMKQGAVVTNAVASGDTEKINANGKAEIENFNKGMDKNIEKLDAQIAEAKKQGKDTKALEAARTNMVNAKTSQTKKIENDTNKQVQQATTNKKKSEFLEKYNSSSIDELKKTTEERKKTKKITEDEYKKIKAEANSLGFGW